MKIDKELMDNLKYGYEVLQEHYGEEVPARMGHKLVDASNQVNALVDEIYESFVEETNHG
jgi:hypothetical protein